MSEPSVAGASALDASVSTEPGVTAHDVGREAAQASDEVARMGLKAAQAQKDLDWAQGLLAAAIARLEAARAALGSPQ